MIPTDLTGFTVEQLRGFAKANDQRIDALRADARGDAEKLAAIEEALDSGKRLDVAIAEALEAEGAEDAVTEAVADGGEGDAAADGDDAEGEGEGDGEAVDPDAAAGEAVASAKLGAGDKPREARPHIQTFEPNDVRAFLRGTQAQRLREGQRVSFASLRRETNHVATRGADITELLPSIIGDRAKGEDRTAAGCFCGPDDARSEIHRSLVSDRPLSDTLPTVTGGDFRFIRQIDLDTAAAGTTVWDCDDQAAFDPETIATWKPCFVLDCENEVTSQLYAVPACAKFNTQAMIGNPNLIANLEHVMGVAYNRTAELQVYAQLLGQASQYNYNAFAPLVGYGAAAKLIKAAGWAMEKIRANHRDTQGYTLAIPAGLRERVLADEFVRGFPSGIETWGDLLARLGELGVDRVVELLDPTAAVTAFEAPGGPPVAAPANTLAQTLLLYRPDNFLLGLGGEIDMGVVASGPDELRQNTMTWFTESFESVTRIGIQPTVAITGDFCDSGIRPALGEGYICD